MSQTWTFHVSEIRQQLFGQPHIERIREELDTFAASGWELVSVEHESTTASTRLYFKKPA